MASQILPFFIISTLILLLQLQFSLAGRYGSPGGHGGSPGGHIGFPGGHDGYPGGHGGFQGGHGGYPGGHGGSPGGHGGYPGGHGGSPGGHRGPPGGHDGYPGGHGGSPGGQRGSPGGDGGFPGGHGGSPGGDDGFPGGRCGSSGELDSVRAGYWFPGENFSASDINSTLFTHLFAAAADLDSQVYQVVIDNAKHPEVVTFTQIVQKINPDVKTLLSIGGGTAKKTEYASMAGESTTRKSFIDSSIDLARKYNFDGLDFNWEYPSTPTEMISYSLLLNEWRKAIQNESETSGKPPLLLSSAVFHSSDYQTLIYPIEALTNDLDWINVKAYDFYGPISSHLTAPPAALFNPSSDAGNGNKDYGVFTWISAGAPRLKVLMGIPYYGYAWKLADEDEHGFFAPTLGPALSSDGSVGYNEIRNFIRKECATTVYNETAVSNYAYSKATWIGYDDIQTVATKVEYIKKSRMLGYFASHVHRDENSVLSQTAYDSWEGDSSD